MARNRVQIDASVKDTALRLRNAEALARLRRLVEGVPEGGPMRACRPARPRTSAAWAGGRCGRWRDSSTRPGDRPAGPGSLSEPKAQGGTDGGFGGRPSVTTKALGAWDGMLRTIGRG